jgi:hypothetical protein
MHRRAGGPPPGRHRMVPKQGEPGRRGLAGNGPVVRVHPGVLMHRRAGGPPPGRHRMVPKQGEPGRRGLAGNGPVVRVHPGVLMHRRAGGPPPGGHRMVPKQGEPGRRGLAGNGPVVRVHPGVLMHRRAGGLAGKSRRLPAWPENPPVYGPHTLTILLDAGTGEAETLGAVGRPPRPIRSKGVFRVSHPETRC